MEYLKQNPAADSPHRKELQEGGQQANIPALKHYVYQLTRILTQMNAGQNKYKGKHNDYISFKEIDMIINSIVIEAVALVLSGELDKIEIERKDDLNKMALAFDVHKLRKCNMEWGDME